MNRISTFSDFIYHVTRVRTRSPTCASTTMRMIAHAEEATEKHNHVSVFKLHIILIYMCERRERVWKRVCIMRRPSMLARG